MLFDKFDKLVAPALDKAVANRTEAQTLTALCDSVLQKLMSGEIRLQEAERSVEAVV